jgi:hypothetical protein
MLARGVRHEYRRQPDHRAVPTLDDRAIGAETVGQWHPELVDELYRTSLEIEQRGLKKTPEYRNAMVRAYEEASWLAELEKLSGTGKTS